ncbi:GDYXXLXY domain-containing protein [Ammoniphilus sp. 3BR4]|uniref:GDYXXLXY domain-containing protein n=1 Tax=Ammoniphilus sp. 3BR4 TaxID=3158265 RepID=UPI003466907A
MLKKFIIFVFLQVFVLTFMAGSHYAVQWYGEDVRLKTAPVDPRDLFYGDYVILNYEISEIDISKFKGNQQPEAGDTLYILVKKEGDYYEIVSAHPDRPTPATDEQVLQGKVDYVIRDWDPQQGETDQILTVRVIYGFERYYVPEGTGKELEDKRGQFDVIVKVSPWGQQLSDIKFIANGVITQWEAQEYVSEHYRENPKGIHILRSQLTGQYQNQERPVWLVDIVLYPDKANEKESDSYVVVVDALTGEILEERKK